jgi:hypothetical protein
MPVGAMRQVDVVIGAADGLATPGGVEQSAPRGAVVVGVAGECHVGCGNVGHPCNVDC